MSLEDFYFYSLFHTTAPLQWWLLASIFVPLLSGIFFLFMPVQATRTANVLGMALSSLLLVIGVVLFSTFTNAQPALGYHFYSQLPLGLQFMGASLQLGLNALSMPFYFLAVVVGFAASIYLLQLNTSRKPLLWGFLLIIQGGILGAFASVDVFYSFLFHEVALLPTLLALLVFGGSQRQAAALQSGIFMLLGSLIMLVGLIAFKAAAGLQTFSMVEWRNTLGALTPAHFAAFPQVAWWLILGGAFILSGLWPFYSWVPRLLTQAPTPVAMLQGGVLKFFALYLILQAFGTALPLCFQSIAPVVSVLCVANIIFIGFAALAQTDLLRLVAYSAVMHMGTLFLALNAHTVESVSGAVLLIVGGGLATALLIMLAGSLRQRLGSLEMSHIGGLRATTPRLGLFLMIGFMSVIALPCFLNFWGEMAVIFGVLKAGLWSVAAIFVGLVLAAAFGLRALGQVLMGPAKPPVLADLSSTERSAAWVLAIPLILFSFIPGQLSEPLHQLLQVFLKSNFTF